MRFRKALQSPAALVLHGFVAGAFLFFTVHPLAGGTPSQDWPATESVLSGLEV
jgi:hypothetical protein